jgi:hypothetical protein
MADPLQLGLQRPAVVGCAQVGGPVRGGVEQHGVAGLTYNLHGTAQPTGLSEDTIKRAIRARDLGATTPRVANRQLQTPVLIPAAELTRWALDQP